VFLNPQLAAINRTRHDLSQETEFLYGVVFRYPPRDIDFYLNIANRGGDHADRLELISCIDQLDKLKGLKKLGEREEVRIRWRTSPETRQILRDRVRELGQAASPRRTNDVAEAPSPYPHKRLG